MKTHVFLSARRGDSVPGGCHHCPAAGGDASARATRVMVSHVRRCFARHHEQTPGNRALAGLRTNLRLRMRFVIKNLDLSVFGRLSPNFPRSLYCRVSLSSSNHRDHEDSGPHDQAHLGERDTALCTKPYTFGRDETRFDYQGLSTPKRPKPTPSTLQAKTPPQNSPNLPTPSKKNNKAFPPKPSHLLSLAFAGHERAPACGPPAAPAERQGLREALRHRLPAAWLGGNTPDPTSSSGGGFGQINGYPPLLPPPPLSPPPLLFFGKGPHTPYFPSSVCQHRGRYKVSFLPVG